MPKTFTEFRVFIASPGGLEAERKLFRDTLHEYNDEVHNRGLIFTPIGWEITLGGFGRPQELINKDLRLCDYFVLLLWDRWGSPPGRKGDTQYSSGCEEEFDLAVQCLADPEQAMRQVVVFFKPVDKRQSNDAGPQLLNVLKFRRELEETKKHLFMTFQDAEELKKHLRHFLAQWTFDHEERPLEHVQILERGVAAWNAWRSKNPTVIPNLFRANLKGAYLSGIDLSKANLVRADLSDADATKGNFHGADLREALLARTNLFGADLRHADLAGATITKAHLKNAQLDGATFADTIIAKTDLSAVVGVETIKHVGPSSIGIDTIYHSNANIPEVFLRGAGIQETFILYARSLVAVEHPIQFYSCFISYSHYDKVFARRLYERLQQRGIRCWLDEKQLLPGADIYHEVDRGIRLWDKVLLCCSEHSLNSWWVDNEIGAAFDKEDYLTRDRAVKNLVLIPLNLDGYIFSGAWESGYRSQILRRMAADFTGWETDETKMEEQIEALVRALRADEVKNQSAAGKS